jgi:hypothetical protein
MRPEVKILAISNVYSRLMHFIKAGDKEHGHFHTYDHGTLLASGKLLVEKLDDNNEVHFSKEFTAPTFIMIEKNSRHVLTALEDNTVASCIHALREVNETIVDSEFIIEETEFADTKELITDKKQVIGRYFRDRGMNYLPIALGSKKE